MRRYECMYILHPELQEEEINQVVEKFQNLVTEQGGIVDKVELMGKRRLAYEVKKLREGFYVLLQFQGEPKIAAELERNLKIAEQVIRYLVVRLEDKKAKAAEKAEVEKAEAAAEAEQVEAEKAE